MIANRSILLQCERRSLSYVTREEREKAENPERSGSQGWDVFSSSSRIFFPFVPLLSDLMKALRIFAPTATVMFGALLGPVPDPFTLMGSFHVAYVLTIVLSFGCGILGILGGLAMLGNFQAVRGMFDRGKSAGSFGLANRNCNECVHPDSLVSCCAEGKRLNPVEHLSWPITLLSRQGSVG
jgi:hypothetical protein